MRKLAASLSLAFLLSTPLFAEPLAVGAKAPSVTVKNHLGEEVDLGAEFAEGVSLIYFYPKADTPGCTKQACNLRDARKLLSEAGIKVFGVSADTIDAQSAFVKKYELSFTLLADTEAAIINAFGVPLRNGKFPGRQSFLIKDGVVVWHQPRAKPLTQAEDAIAALADIEKQS